MSLLLFCKIGLLQNIFDILLFNMLMLNFEYFCSGSTSYNSVSFETTKIKQTKRDGWLLLFDIILINNFRGVQKVSNFQKFRKVKG